MIEPVLILSTIDDSVISKVVGSFLIDIVHRKDLIWMQRTPDAGFENDRPQIEGQQPSVQVGKDGKLK